MVRHEAAEALGGIGTPAVLPHLRKWLTREDSPTVVKESCQVAIDMWEVNRCVRNIFLHELTFSLSMRIQTNFSMPTACPQLLILHLQFDYKLNDEHR